MTLPASGQISLSQVNTELGLGSTTTISLGQASVRSLAGIASGAISLNDLHGKTSEFAFTISTNQTNANLATLATAAGWNGSSKLVATINYGVYISSNSTGTPALTVSGSFPGGVTLINNGYIVGMGGAGGQGAGIATYTGVAGTAGSAGGKAMSVASTITITNNGTIAGGGGGGGGGASYLGSTLYGKGNVNVGVAGGGGGGGRSSNSTNSAGGAAGTASGSYFNVSGGAGGSGTVSAVGAAGARGYYDTFNYGGYGGAGGAWGAAGSTGGTGTPSLRAGPYSGGAAGACLTGNSYITWSATGTRYGAIS